MNQPATDRLSSLSAADFRALNASSWNLNVPHWQRHVSGDQFRTNIFREVCLAITAERSAFPTTAEFEICDLGCGDGTLLSRLQAEGSFSGLSGVDQCSGLLAIAQTACPDAQFFQRDLEAPGVPPIRDLHAITCVLTLIELVRLEGAFEFAWRALRDRGLLLTVVLDPAVEIYRLLTAKLKMPGTALYDLAGDLAIASHYEAQGVLSPAPYFRIVRSIDAYIEGLIGAGFTIESVVARPSLGNPLSASPRAIFISARKSSAGRKTEARASPKIGLARHA